MRACIAEDWASADILVRHSCTMCVLESLTMLLVLTATQDAADWHASTIVADPPPPACRRKVRDYNFKGLYFQRLWLTSGGDGG